MNAIELSNLSFSYNQQKVLKDINLTIKKGEFVGIIGPNGAGKSTLLRIMGGILKNFSGEVRILGRNIKTLKPKDIARIIGFVPQETHFLHNYLVEDIILMGRYPYLEPFQHLSQEDMDTINHAVEMTGLHEIIKRPVNSISSGERQMVVICRALAQKPEILLLDEPTSHLDIQHQASIMGLLKNLNSTGMTVVVVNHDLNLAARYSEKLILLDKGTIYKTGIPEEIIERKTLNKVYGIEVEIIEHPEKKVPQIFLR
ncbi:MAG: ABC transporter ATP-binding protein [candidate division WOR-3 bacterium]|nr:ABC transporter ATP-binding protein [candidate division WOR-3 bacterium]